MNDSHSLPIVANFVPRAMSHIRRSHAFGALSTHTSAVVCPTIHVGDVFGTNRSVCGLKVSFDKFFVVWMPHC